MPQVYLQSILPCAVKLKILTLGVVLECIILYLVYKYCHERMGIVTNNTILTSLWCEEREGLLDTGREFVCHVGGDSDDSSDDSSDPSGGDEEGQACEDDIFVDIAGVAPLQ
jgi:hypothetical protein